MRRRHILSFGAFARASLLSPNEKEFENGHNRIRFRKVYVFWFAVRSALQEAKEKPKSTYLFEMFDLGFLVGTVRLELMTSCMSSMRSNQLSYAPEQI